MIEEALRKFAQENFSHKYYPALHGETEKIQPLALVVKRNRPIWKRPFAKLEMTILAELAKYVSSGEEVNKFHDSLKSKIKEEIFQQKQQNIDMGRRKQEVDVGLAGYLQGNIKLCGDQGVLELGTISQKYIDDPDLRGLLAQTALDVDKMKSFDDSDLLLITSAICSEKFELKGDRFEETEVKAEVSAPSQFIQFFKPDARVHYRDTRKPPEVASRNSPGPFLFKCCHVDYIKKDNRLEIRKGEYVGKTVTRDIFPNESTEEKADDNDTLVEIYTDETDSPDPLNVADVQKLDSMLQNVLLPKNREKRKELVSKYLSWFERGLGADQTRFLINEAMTSDDCEFLRHAYLTASEGSTILDISSLSKEDMQSYGVVFKHLDDVSDEKWERIEQAGANNLP